MKKLITLLLIPILLLSGCFAGDIYEADIPVEEFPYKIVIHEERDGYSDTFIVRDYRETAGGIAFKGYYGYSRSAWTWGFFYFEQETIFTGCRFDITERK